MVWLLVDGSVCGGTLIDDQHVLTAAHCTIDPNLNNYHLYVGTVDYGGRVNGNPVRPLSVSKRYQHEAYDASTIANDISILKLSERIPASSTIGYVCLPQSSSLDLQMGDNVTVTGWGSTTRKLLDNICTNMSNRIVVKENIDTIV